jgi:hypothetical protein
MFGNMFGGRPAPSQQQAPAQPAQPPAQQQAPASPPPSQSGVAPSEPLRMAPSQPPQGQPAQPPAAPSQPSFSDLIARVNGGGQQAPAPAPDDPAQFASDFISAMMNTPEMPTAPIAPRINPAALREAFGAVDLTSGLDLGQLTEALQGRAAGDANPADLTRAALQTQGLNIIEAMAPVLNQMVQQAMEQAVQASTRQATHGLTSSSLVQEFVALHPYAKSPMMMNMVQQFCNAIVAQNPANINRSEIFKAIDLVFQGMSQAVRPDQGPGEQLLPPNAQTGFSGIFG